MEEGARADDPQRRSRLGEQLSACESLLSGLADLERFAAAYNAFGLLMPVRELRTRLKQTLIDDAAVVRRRELVNACAANDVSTIGLLIASGDVNEVRSSHFPQGSSLRRLRGR